jgi:hypothetical protein
MFRWTQARQKPVVVPVLRRDGAPRGLRYCIPFQDWSAYELVSGIVPAKRSGGGSSYNSGIVVTANGVGQENWFSHVTLTATFAAPCSIEFVFHYNGTTNVSAALFT